MVIDAADVPASRHNARNEARAATRDGHLAHVIAAVLYAAIVFAVIVAFARLPSASRIAVAYASLAPQLLILVWSLRLSLRIATWTFVTQIVFGIFLISYFAKDSARTLEWASVFAILIIPAIVFLLLRSLEFLTDEQMHKHLAELGLTAYFELWAFLNDAFFATRLTFVFALACSMVTEHLLLFRLRKRRPSIAEKHLLLLRAFAGLDERRDLLEDLRDTWRRIGTIELFDGSDVATLTVGPLLSFFAAPHSQSLNGEEYVARQIAQLDTKIEADGRYPLNVMRSSEEWKSAFPLLEKRADVVLMDLRGFTMQHVGCVWELEHFRDHRNLGRVVFLIDGHTDLPELETLLDGREITVLDYRQRLAEKRRALFDLLLNVAYA